METIQIERRIIIIHNLTLTLTLPLNLNFSFVPSANQRRHLSRCYLEVDPYSQHCVSIFATSSAEKRKKNKKKEEESRIVDREKATDEVAATSASMAHSSASASSPSSSIFTNYPLVSAIAAFAVAQSIKFFTAWFKERRWDLKQLVGSGGMPSSHSATVTALAAAIGFQEGIGGHLFATALVLACIVMYDATGVRLQAGRQAEVLNQIVYELPAEHPLAESRPLRELLGHTPPQVIAGGLLGIMTAAIGRLITVISS